MLKKIIPLYLVAAAAAQCLVAVSPAQATTPDYDTFTCRTDRVIEGSRSTQFRFATVSLGTSDVSLVPVSKDLLVQSPGSVMNGICADYIIASTEKGLKIVCDEDGMQFTTITLSSESDYREGNLKIEEGGGSGIGKRATSITCSRQTDR